jgi:RNA polymerase sigma factor (sigma-70 family)
LTRTDIGVDLAITTMSAGISTPNQFKANQAFVTTRWSLVIAAGGKSSAESEEALAQLCRTYWYPLYTFIRRQGRSPEDAEDLAQAFFAYLLEKKALRSVQRDKGKFRSFLLASLKNFLANDWDKKHAAKRGGRHAMISLDANEAEDRYLRELSHDGTPERLFERTWAVTVLDSVLQQLRKEYCASGKSELFELLQDQLIGAEHERSYAELGVRLGMKEGALRMTVLRMRRHFSYLLRAAIAQTVGSASEIDEELRYLISIIGR